MTTEIFRVRRRYVFGQSSPKAKFSTQIDSVVSPCSALAILSCLGGRPELSPQLFSDYGSLSYLTDGENAEDWRIKTRLA